MNAIIHAILAFLAGSRASIRLFSLINHRNNYHGYVRKTTEDRISVRLDKF